MKNAQRILKKVLSWVMVLAMVLSFVPVGSVAAAEAGDILYLKPNSNWTQASARFAAYFFGGSGSTWVSMTDSNGDGIYEVTIPSGSWTNVIFCRMNPGNSTNSWDTKWNQTGDLALPTGDLNLYTIDAGQWDSGENGSWSTYTYVEPSFTYTVAGTAGLCGTDWDIANTANDMTKNASGVYEKVYTDVAAGSYAFKVVRDHSWDVAWPGSNYTLTVSETGSTVTVTFDVSTQTVKATVVEPLSEYTVTFNGTNITSNGVASATEGSTYTATLTADEGYDLPETITVTMGGTPVTPTWDASTGSLSIANVTGDVVITAAGVAQPQGITVYFINTSAWSEVAAYAWDANGGLSWPGTVMTKTGKQINGFDVYTVTFDTAYENVIFNNNGNGVQTADLTLEAGKYFDYATKAWYNSAEDVPAIDPLETDVTIAGSFTGWAAEPLKRNAAGDNVCYVSLELEADTTYEFKIIQGGTWLGNAGTITASVQDWIFNGSEAANCQIKTAAAGIYVFAFNMHTRGLSVTYPVVSATYTVTFNGTNVTSNGAASVTEDSTYTATLTADEGYDLPETITVTVGGNTVTPTWDAATGSLSIANVTGDVVINAVGVAQATEPEMITVYFRNDWLWSEVRVYYWDSASAADSAWPGVVMEKVGTAQYNTEDRDVYAAKVPADAKILFNGPENGNPSNTQQTPDILDAQDGDAYYIHWADGNQVSKFTYLPGGEGGEGGEPGETVEYEVTFHFADTLGWGTVNLYTWTENNTALTGQWPGTATAKDSTGYYSMTVKYEAPAGQGLNFIFNNGNAQTVDLKVAASEFVNNKAEKWVVLTTPTEGKYNAAIVDDPSMIVTSPVVDGGSVTFNYGGAAQSVSVAGSFNSWTPAAMTKNADGIWTLTVSNLAAGDYQYKFVVDTNNWILDPMNGNVFTEENENQNSVFYILSGGDTEDDNKITIRIHYKRTAGDYDGWNLWVWGSNMGGHQVDFDSTDSDGAKVATIVLEDARAYQDISFKERLSVEGNEWKDQGSSDRSIDLSTVVSGTIDYYLPSGSCVYGDDVIRKNKVSSVELDYDNNAVIVTTVQAIANPETAFTLVKDQGTIPVTIQAVGSKYSLVLPENSQLDLAELYKYQVMFEDAPYSITIDAAYASDKFAAEYTYTGNDLGATYYAYQTVFRVWAPTAEAVSVKLYSTGSDLEAGAAELGTYSMTKDVNGTWIAIIQGDLKNVYYTYLVAVNGQTVEANDPYSVATGVNGMRSMVTDLPSTNPQGWENDGNPNKVTSQTDAIIYELHVRDFSIDASSGVSLANRGKFLAFTEYGTTVNGAGTTSTGIDYLKKLGITHLHLLPIYDYASVDETKCTNFNWGYDPQNYNVPEGSYSTNPYDGNVRVNEMKQMVMALHENGISVVMDVVYNHVYDASTFSFNQIVPGYFSRVSSNASGCGNDTASEREMVRKYIVESVLYWTEEYHIDGFRFDLVGLLDVETINQIVTEVHKVRPDVIFYGEGWDMDSTNKEPGTEMSKQGNSSKTPGFAYFSDSIRNGLAGDNSGTKTGFVSGAGNGGAMVTEWLGKPWWTNNPQQVVQYASCHDNYTLADKLVLSTGKSAVDATVIKMNNLAAAFYMTSQGIPFIHAGEEILREKINADGSRNHNSYNSSDAVNHIDWNDAEKYADNSAYYQGLIAFRKAHPALRLSSASQVSARVFTRADANDLVAFWIDGSDLSGETHDSIYVIFNAASSAQTVELPAGNWDVCVNSTKAGTEPISTVSGSVTVSGISAMILVQETTTETPSAGTAVKSEVALPGSFNNWNTANYMNFVEDSTTVVTQTLALPAGTYTFKIKIGDSWYGNGGTIEDTTDTTSATGWDMDASAGDCTLKATGGAYTFIYDTTTKKLIIKHDADAGGIGDPNEYYLYGWINSEDYALGFETGDYKFDANGKLTVTFTADSYVGVKNGDSSEKYMTDGWLGNVTSATMYNVNQVTGITGDKMMIPGGVKVTLTLTHNVDGTITLSYTAQSQAVKDESGVQDGVTLHCWNWSFAQIEANMALIAAQGYTAIQTSPIQPLKEATNLSYNSVGGNWWVYYQPVDFEITTDSGNALGTKDELASMIKTAHEYGIQVIVDVVANHLGNQTGNNLSNKIPEYLLDDAYWHDITINTSNYDDRFDVTQHCMGGLPDLNTANDDIQKYVLDFLKECVDMGVDGFRFDAAKHIETPEDDASFASDFWPTVVGGAESYAKDTYNKDLYIYGEMLDIINGVPLSAYTKYMAITDNAWGNTLRGNVASGNAVIAPAYNKAVAADLLVLWAESHDTFATDNASQSSAGVSEADIIKTWALVAARADAMGLYFARPASMEQAIGVASVTGWADPAVKAINLFHNAFTGETEVVSSENGICYVERGTTGVVLVSLSKTRAAGISVTAHAMADGTYVDQITGNIFTVADGKITGQIGEGGIAVIYNATVVPETYDITVSETTGGTAAADKTTAEMGETVTITVKPDQGKVVSLVTVLDENNKEVPVTDNGNGTYTFTQPKSNVKIVVSFKAQSGIPGTGDETQVALLCGMTAVSMLALAVLLLDQRKKHRV